MTSPERNDLYQRLQAFSLSQAGAQVTFESKLAIDNGWTLGHAQEVTAEYRRFLYLTQTAGHMVCPSEDVDQAWHLHLTQTRSYQDLCDTVLGRFLHHTQSNGGPDESIKHRHMYSATLEAYAKAFGSAAPRQI